MIGISDIINEIIKTEGGFTNDKDDNAHYGIADPRKGQKYNCYCTKYGITQDTLSHWLGRQASVEEVKTLDIPTASMIYENHYYFSPRFDALPSEIQAQMVDIGVNSGPKTAIKLLQRVIKAISEKEIDIDGILGPETLKISHLVAETLGNKFNNLIVEERKRFYLAIIEIRPKNAKYKVGWMARAEKFRCNE